MGVTLLSNEEITFDILLNGEVLEGDYMVNVLIPDGMRGEPKVYLKNGEEYVELESIVSGNYIIFSTPKLGTHRIVATEEWDIVNDGALEWWGWLLISISIAIVISGVVVFVILYKKGLIRKKK